MLAHGDFEIPESCYIDATGHLNSVEVNICYNQLLYVILAQSIASEVVPALDVFTLEHYHFILVVFPLTRRAIWNSILIAAGSATLALPAPALPSRFAGLSVEPCPWTGARPGFAGRVAGSTALLGMWWCAN